MWREVRRFRSKLLRLHHFQGSLEWTCRAMPVVTSCTRYLMTMAAAFRKTESISGDHRLAQRPQRSPAAVRRHGPPITFGTIPDSVGTG